MFDLNKAIAHWREEMSTAGIKSSQVLEELENHLRDEIERQIRSGLDEKHAYQIAIASIGEAELLRGEFAKLPVNHGWGRALNALYIIFVPCMLLINVWTLLEYDLSLLERTMGFLAVSTICLYLACLPYFLKSLPSAAVVRLAKGIKVASFLFGLWPLWALLEAVNIVRSNLGIVSSVVLWCLYAAVAVTAFAFGLNQTRHEPEDSGDPPPPFPRLPAVIPPSRPSPPDFESCLPRTQILNAVVRETLTTAGEEASRLGHDFIGTEHVLLGTLKLAKGPFEELLQRLHLDRTVVRAEIERSVCPVLGKDEAESIPLTPRASKALCLAANEAKKLKQPSIGAEHIFLGLLLERGGVAGRVLRQLGIGIKTAREEVAHLLRTNTSC